MCGKCSLTVANFNHLLIQDLPFDKMHFFWWNLNLLGGVRVRSMLCTAGVQILRLA